MPSGARVERLFSARMQLLEPKRDTTSDKNFEISLLLEFDEYYLFYRIVLFFSHCRRWFR